MGYCKKQIGIGAPALVFATLLACFAACSDEKGGGPPESGPEVKNLIFITVDTLRADHLSCYGYDKIETPNMDRLASEGIRYAKTFSAAPWTCPSMASIFTSLYPEAHGMVLHPIRNSDHFRTLSPKLFTLAEALKQGGYRTCALSEQIWCSKTFGFSQGFDEFTMLEKKKRELADKAIDRIRRFSKDEPFFMYLHFLDPHTPYLPPKEFEIPLPAAEKYKEFKELDWDQWWQRLWSLNRDTPGIDELLPYIISLYDGEIRFVDHEIGRLLDCIEACGLADNTVVSLVADHGEAFLEHAMLHGSTLFNEELSVPMIIKVPWEKRFAGLEIDPPVSTLDLMPTLLDIMGLPVPKGIHGEVITPRAIEGRPGLGIEHAKFIHSESAYDRAWKKTQSGRFSMIVNKDSRNGWLFDLEADPTEQGDVLDLFPDAFQEHWKETNDWIETEGHWKKPDSPVIDLSGEVEERLRGLGYLK